MSRHQYVVQLTQHDFPHCKLCRTRQNLRWTARRSGGRRQAFFDSRWKYGYTWSPTCANTNWYKYYSRWIGSPRRIDAGRTVLSKNEAKYWNKDFPLRSRKTEVYHRLVLEGYADGGARYYKTVNRSGEHWKSLHSHVKAWR